MPACPTFLSLPNPVSVQLGCAPITAETRYDVLSVAILRRSLENQSSLVAYCRNRDQWNPLEHIAHYQSREAIADLTRRASDHFAYGVHFQEDLAWRGFRDIPGQLSHQRLRASERLASSGWAIAGCEQPSQRDMIAPFDQRHGMRRKRREGPRQGLFGRVVITGRRGDLTHQPLRDRDVLRHSIVRGVLEQRAGVLLGSIQLAQAQPILGFGGAMANAIEAPAIPTFALVERLHTLQGLGGFTRFAAASR